MVVVLLLVDQLLEQEMAPATMEALVLELQLMDLVVVEVPVVPVLMHLLLDKQQLLEVTDRQIVS